MAKTLDWLMPVDVIEETNKRQARDDQQLISNQAEEAEKQGVHSSQSGPYDTHQAQESQAYAIPFCHCYDTILLSFHGLDEPSFSPVLKLQSYPIL